MELYNWKVYQPPKEVLNNYIYLWDSDWMSFCLAIEDLEFRIYSYEYWSGEDLEDEWHLDDSRVSPRGRFFEWAVDYLDIDSLWYVKAEFSSEDAVDMAKELLETCNSQLDYQSYRLDDGNGIPSEDLVDFIKRWITKIKYSKVYAYYK